MKMKKENIFKKNNKYIKIIHSKVNRYSTKKLKKKYKILKKTFSIVANIANKTVILKKAIVLVVKKNKNIK